MKQIVLYLSIVLLFPFTLKSQEKGVVDRQVDEILVQMPCENLTQLNKLMDKVLSYGSPFLVTLTEKTTPLGKGNNIAVRYTINSLARYTSNLEDKSKKQLLEEVLLKAIQTEEDYEVKVFFINQLNLIGSGESVDKLKPLLVDSQYCEPVSQLFLYIRTEKAKNAFIDALPNVEGQRLVTIVKALGDLKGKEINDKLLALVDHKEPKLQKVVYASLASIGMPESYEAFMDASKRVDFEYEENNIVGSFITYTEALGENGYLKSCRKACKSIIDHNGEPELLHNRAAAINIFAHFFPKKATKLILKEVDNKDEKFRSSILSSAQKLVDKKSVKKWIAKGESSSDAVKEDIILMLGRADEDAAVPFFIESLTSSSDHVRSAAIISLASLAREKAIPTIVQHIVEGKDIDQSKECLLCLIDYEKLNLIGESLDSSAGKSRAALIDVISAKAGDQYFEQVLSYSNDTNSDVKEAALNAMQSISRAQDLDALLLLLESVERTYVETIQKAIYRAVEDQQNMDLCVDKLLTSLAQSDDKARFVRILPKVGGEKALKEAYDLYYQSQGSLKESALEALCEWKDYTAAAALYTICEKSIEYQHNAFVGFVSLISHSNLPNDQKLLELKKIMTLAASNEQKLKVITSLGGIKTYQSLIYASTFLEESELQQAACQSIRKIALPRGGKSDGFIGEETFKILEKVRTCISGKDSNYFKISIQKYMDKMKKDGGYVSLFNGKDLSHWKGFIAPPLKVEKMNAKVLSKRQQMANIKMHNNWSVKDGAIVFRGGKGANLCSEKEYADFEMLIDWRITKNGDSGIYLRGTPQVQIWDIARVKVGAQVGSGGLYNNKKNPSKPLVVADNPVGEWNTFRIRMKGDKVTVFLNGHLVVNSVIIENYWDRSRPIFSKGAIELQAHGTDIKFRDIYVREIKNTINATH
ncbi:DUF1080 domain-containing protein [Halosquirtibacter xylanolyticus]|uniref:DUF1080 domain-containing protein n=1 Tax=Halosquirtibacter xylanolyticus TaxID=3374599 RepID=UPI003747AF84|nr:DUF1080 domain-containing protein [Prolixibacteraceae bacterium]